MTLQRGESAFQCFWNDGACDNSDLHMQCDGGGANARRSQ